MTKRVVNKVIWHCDNCDTEQEALLQPMNWMTVKLGNLEGHLCPSCNTAMRQLFNIRMTLLYAEGNEDE